MIITRGDGRYVVDKEVSDSDVKVILSLHEINDMLKSLHEAERLLFTYAAVKYYYRQETLQAVRHVMGRLDSKKPS